MHVKLTCCRYTACIMHVRTGARHEHRVSTTIRVCVCVSLCVCVCKSVSVWIYTSTGHTAVATEWIYMPLTRAHTLALATECIYNTCRWRARATACDIHWVEWVLLTMYVLSAVRNINTRQNTFSSCNYACMKRYAGGWWSWRQRACC